MKKELGFISVSVLILSLAWGLGSLIADVKILSYAIFIASFFIALYYRQTSSVLLLISIAVFAMLLAYEPYQATLSLEAKDLLWIASWYIVPLNILIFSLLAPKPVFSFASLFRVLFVAIEALAVVFLATTDHASAVAATLTYSIFSPFLIEFLMGIPQIAVLLATLYATILLVKSFFDKYKVTTLGTIFMFVSFLISLYFYPESSKMLLFVGAGSVIVSISLIRLSYRLAYYDELTGIKNRRALEESMQGGKQTIAMMDIDFFKKFNDTHGHDVGDDVLRMVAGEINKVRGGGRAYRYGGEEFTILFDNRPLDKAFGFLEEVRTNIEKKEFFKKGDKNPLKVTISIGAAYDMKKADDALYKAKANGRNNTVLSEG